MSPSIGYAVLPVLPSMRGVSEAINQQLAGVMPQAGQKAGEQLAGGMTQSLATLGKTVGAVVATGVAAATAAAGTAVVKGWDRLTTIQDATSALEISLGDATAAATLLDDVLDTVKGTPFNLDQFAAAAQVMGGMGVDAEKIPRYLEAIGEASATQGKRANEFADRLSALFGEVSATGQLMMTDVRRIQRAGVDPLRILGNAADETTASMQKLISEGAVPAGWALDTLADGILDGSTGINGAVQGLSGTMEQLRENMSGAVAGIEPAMARLGVAVLEPFSPMIVAAANAVTDAIDGLAEKASGWAKGLAESGGAQQFLDFLTTAPGQIDGLVGKLEGVGPAAGAALAGLTALGTGSIPVLGRFLPAINPVAAAITGLVLATPEARKALGDLIVDVAPLVAELAEKLAPVLVDLSKIAGDILPPAIDLFGEGLKLAAAAAGVLAGIIAPISGILADLGPLIGITAVAWLTWRGIDRIIGGIGDRTNDLAVGLFDLVGQLERSNIGQALTNIFGGFADAMKNLFAVSGDLTGIEEGFKGGLTRMKTGAKEFSAVARSAIGTVGVASVIGFAAAWQKAGREAKASMDRIKADMDAFSVESVGDTGAAVRDRYGQLMDELDAKTQGFAGTAHYSMQMVTESIGAMFGIGDQSKLNRVREINEARKEIELLGAQTVELEQAYIRAGQALADTEITPDDISLDPKIFSDYLVEAERWARALDIDVVSLGSKGPAALAEAVETVMKQLRSETGLTSDQLNDLAESIGTTLPESLDEAGKPAGTFADALADIIGYAELTGESLDGIELSPEKIAQLEADAKAVEEAIKIIEEAGVQAGEAFRSAFDVVSLQDEPVDPKQLKAAEKAVEAAREQVAEAEKAHAASGQTADELERSAKALAEARDRLGEANENLQDLRDSDSPLNPAKVQAFYETALEDAETFGENYRVAIEAGYDPQLMARLLAAGPEQAGGLLEVLVSDTSTAFVDMVNDGEAALAEFTTLTVEQARLTQKVIQASGDEGQRMAELLPVVVAISTAQIRSSSQLSIEELEKLTGASIAEMREAARLFDLELIDIQASIDRIMGDLQKATGMSTGQIFGGGQMPQGARASGGPVWPGAWVVGEEGPEIVEFGASGYVYNAAETAALLRRAGAGQSAGSAAGGGVSMAPAIYTAADAESVGRILDAKLRGF